MSLRTQITQLQRPPDEEDEAWANVWRLVGALAGRRHLLERKYLHVGDEAWVETAEACARLQKALAAWLITLRTVYLSEMRPDRIEE